MSTRLRNKYIVRETKMTMNNFVKSSYKDLNIICDSQGLAFGLNQYPESQLLVHIFRANFWTFSSFVISFVREGFQT